MAVGTDCLLQYNGESNNIVIGTSSGSGVRGMILFALEVKPDLPRKIHSHDPLALGTRVPSPQTMNSTLNIHLPLSRFQVALMFVVVFLSWEILFVVHRLSRINRIPM